MVSDSLRPNGFKGFSVHGMLLARLPEWVAIASSRGSSLPRDRIHVFCIAGDSLLLSHQEKPQSTTLHSKMKKKETDF